jgi:hypothetical protein
MIYNITLHIFVHGCHLIINNFVHKCDKYILYKYYMYHIIIYITHIMQK